MRWGHHLKGETPLVKMTDTHHFSELVTPQIQPLKLCEPLHASVSKQHTRTDVNIKSLIL